MRFAARRLLVLVALVAAGSAVTAVLAQRGDDREPDRRPATGRAAQSGPSGPGAGPSSGPGSEEMMGPGTRLEAVMVRPGRVYVRDVWRVGRFECRPWNADPDTPKSWLRVNALMARVEERPDEKATGVEVVLEDEIEDRTFIYDAEQIRDLLQGLTSLATASERLREPQEGARRHAVFTLNGLELGMNPRRTGGYLAPLGPDGRSVGLSPDNFNDLRRLLEEARDLLTRESGRDAGRDAGAGRDASR
jgi:hypothetical protein